MEKYDIIGSLKKVGKMFFKYFLFIYFSKWSNEITECQKISYIGQQVGGNGVKWIIETKQFIGEQNKKWGKGFIEQ